MLGAYALGVAALGGLASTALTPFIPRYTMRLEGDVDLIMENGEISFSSINGGVDFI